MRIFSSCNDNQWQFFLPHQFIAIISFKEKKKKHKKTTTTTKNKLTTTAWFKHKRNYINLIKELPFSKNVLLICLVICTKDLVIKLNIRSVFNNYFSTLTIAKNIVNGCHWSCSKQSRNLHNSGTKLPKVGIPRVITKNGSPESPAQFQNCALLKVGMLLIVGILHFVSSCMVHSLTIPVIWLQF